MSSRPPPIVLVPPPFLYVVTFLAGFWLQRLSPLRDFAFPSPAGLVGLALIALGVLCAFGSALLFLVRKTTLIPHGAASQLVTAGAYRFTRNPMYLGLAIIYLGVALRLNALVPMILIVLPLLAIDRFVIPFEEARLRALRGAEYEQYCARVRRWI